MTQGVETECLGVERWGGGTTKGCGQLLGCGVCWVAGLGDPQVLHAPCAIWHTSQQTNSLHSEELSAQLRLLECGISTLAMLYESVPHNAIKVPKH